MGTIVVLKFICTADKSTYEEEFTIEQMIYGVDGQSIRQIISELRIEGYIVVDAYIK